MDEQLKSIKPQSGLWEGYPITLWPVTFPFDNADGIWIRGYNWGYKGMSLGEEEERKIRSWYMQYLNEHETIKNVYLYNWRAFESLKECRKDLEHIVLDFNLGDFEEVYKWSDNFVSASTYKKEPISVAEYDVKPLYLFEKLKSIRISENKTYGYFRKINLDLSRFKELEKYSGEVCFTENMEVSAGLKTLELELFEEKDIQKLSRLKQIDTLKLYNSSIQTLTGCESLPKLQCLYLYDNEELKDISNLKYVKDTLKALRIKNCNQIEDFSVLEELENLELLELSGRNNIPSLAFIKKLKKLKTFEFSVNVLDNDISPCFNLEHVICPKRKLSYNNRFKSLPKIGYNKDGSSRTDYVKGNEDIEMWRRFE